MTHKIRTIKATTNFNKFLVNILIEWKVFLIYSQNISIFIISTMYSNYFTFLFFVMYLFLFFH